MECCHFRTTKSKNSLIKYTLEATEYGVGKVVTTTKPIVDRLEKPSTYRCILRN